MEEPHLSKTERRDTGSTGGTHGRKPTEPFGQGRLKFWQLLDDNFVKGIGSWLLHKQSLTLNYIFFLRGTVLTFSEAVVMVTQGWPFLVQCWFRVFGRQPVLWGERGFFRVKNTPHI